MGAVGTRFNQLSLPPSPSPRLGAATVVESLHIPSVFLRLLHNKLCFLRHGNDPTLSPLDWHLRNVSSSNHIIRHLLLCHLLSEVICKIWIIIIVQNSMYVWRFFGFSWLRIELGPYSECQCFNIHVVFLQQA